MSKEREIAKKICLIETTYKRNKAIQEVDQSMRGMVKQLVNQEMRIRERENWKKNHPWK